MPRTPATSALEELAAAYESPAVHNEAVHRRLTAAAWADPLPASLLDAATGIFGEVRVLGICVVKGPFFSLWLLLARVENLSVQVSAVSSLAGQPMARHNHADQRATA